MGELKAFDWFFFFLKKSLPGLKGVWLGGVSPFPDQNRDPGAFSPILTQVWAILKIFLSELAFKNLGQAPLGNLRHCGGNWKKEFLFLKRGLGKRKAVFLFKCFFFWKWQNKTIRFFSFAPGLNQDSTKKKPPPFYLNNAGKQRVPQKTPWGGGGWMGP